MISASNRTANFHYAIRHLVSAAEARERAGRSVVYLNIGDPQAYGFRPPAHVVEAADLVLTALVNSGDEVLNWVGSQAMSDMLQLVGKITYTQA